MNIMSSYDVVIVGGGLNGIGAGAYLAKAGASVAIFEARNEAGTFCDTEEILRPGVRANLHASYLTPWSSPCYEELELERFGFKPLVPEYSLFMPFENEKLLIYHAWNAQKTYEWFKEFNERDAETIKKFFNYMADNLQMYMMGTYRHPTHESLPRGAQLICGSPGFPEPEDFLRMNGFQLADYLFEDDYVKTFALSICETFSGEPENKPAGAFGLVVSLLQGIGWTVGNCKGGSHNLTHAVTRCFLHYGGELFQACPVDKIIVKDNVATGVQLADDAVYPGQTVEAKKAVISDLTPVPTFFWLVGEENCPPEVVSQTKLFDYEGHILCSPFWLLKERLDFKAFKWAEKLDPGFRDKVYAFHHGAESPDDILRMHSSLLRREIPDPPVCLGASFLYTVLDPTQAPPGFHTALSWPTVPFDIKGKGAAAWDDIREDYADKVEDVLSKYAPNLKEAKVDRYVHTPLDNVRKNQSQLRGTWSGGPVSVSQFFDTRPLPCCDGSRTPINKLYTTEVQVVRGTPLVSTYLTASDVAEDLGIRDQPWWTVQSPAPYINYLKRRGIDWKMKVE
jgi:phytoene dehydrogenase-like protein